MRMPRAKNAGDTLRLEESRDVLAAMLGMARETLSRALSRLREKGLIELHGRDIRIVDAQGLRAIARKSEKL